MAKIQCGWCGTHFQSDSLSDAKALKECPRCGHSPFIFDVTEESEEGCPSTDEGKIRSRSDQYRHSLFNPALYPQFAKKMRIFAFEAEGVCDRIVAIATIFFLLATLGLGISTFIVWTSVGRGDGLIALADSALKLVYFFFAYLLFLLCKAIALGLKYLSIIAGQSAHRGSLSDEVGEEVDAQ